MERERRTSSCRLELLAQNILERHGVGGELGDTLAQLLHRHLLLIEVEAEVRLVVQVGTLRNVLGRRRTRVELLRHRRVRVVQLF